MTKESGRYPKGSGYSAEPEPEEVSTLTGLDPSRESDMDRGFHIAMLTLNFSLHHTSCAHRFYADGMNNRNGHLTPYMAARVIAATMAAHQAILLERHAVVQFLREEANAARHAQANAAVDHPDKLYRMGQKDGLLLASMGIQSRHHRAASGIETEGHDRADGHGAEHESQVVATSDETPNLSKDSPGISTPIRGE